MRRMLPPKMPYIKNVRTLPCVPTKYSNANNGSNRTRYLRLNFRSGFNKNKEQRTANMQERLVANPAPETEYLGIKRRFKSMFKKTVQPIIFAGICGLFVP